MQLSLPEAASHPQDIVVSPLNVEVVVIAQSIHDDVRPGPRS